jgi:hypothetical protein
MSSFNYTSNTIRKKVVIEALKKLGGSQKRIHNLLCKISGKIKESVIKSSLYSRAKGTFDTSKRLRHARNSEKYHLYLNDIFVFPQKAIKKNVTTANDKKIRKAEEKIVDLNIYIVDLKNKNLTLQNQLLKANKKVMRKHQQIFSLKSKIKAEHKNKRLNRKREFKAILCREK